MFAVCLVLFYRSGGLQSKGGNKIVMCEVLRTLSMTVWDVMLNSLVEVY